MFTKTAAKPSLSRATKTARTSRKSACLFLACLGLYLPALSTHTADAPAAAEPDPNKVIITMGDQKLTYGEFKSFINVLPPETQQAAKGEGRRKAAEELVKLKLLSSQARAKKLDQLQEYQEQLKIMQDNILVGLLLRNIQNELTTEDEIKQYYESHKADMERVTVRYIVIPTVGPDALKDDEAKTKVLALKSKIQGGADFAAVAKAESKDSGSAPQGGLLPAFGKGDMDAEFEKVAFGLKPGQISDPVKSQYGYNLIKVENHDTAPLDEVHDAIANALRQEKFEKMVADLITKANPKYDESFFTAPAPGGTNPTPAPVPADGIPRPEK